MPVTRGGQYESGLDRALDAALDAQLDDVLESGVEPGEAAAPRMALAPIDKVGRPWQRPLKEKRRPPSSDESLASLIKSLFGGTPDDSGGSGESSRPHERRGPDELRGSDESHEPAESKGSPRMDRSGGSRGAAAVDKGSPRMDRSGGSRGAAAVDKGATTAGAGNDAGPLAAFVRRIRGWFRSSDDPVASEWDMSSNPAPKRPSGDDQRAEARSTGDSSREGPRATHFRDDLTGVVVIHGIGRQLAGQTLLDWTRPLVELLMDARVADPRLAPPNPSPGGLPGVTDPVFRSNIDFSGETFPAVQLRIPRRTDVPADNPWGQERRWIFTEAWWAAEVRPPTLQMMTSWLGEQGGVARIVQGIQDNMLGTGPLGRLARVSLQAFVSVIVSFVLLVFLVLLGVSRLLSFGPLKDFVALQLASSFLTDWFGGARTLLRDPTQSANVRRRLVSAIKALRAYGCRDVVVIAHSGGTMASLMTLTDPAYPRLRVQKLITIGEALNLGWRLEDEDPDVPPPTPPEGNRMRGDLATWQPQLSWRDFWGTHDPAPAGSPPQLPRGMTDPGAPRFTAERVYNRMAIGEDHGGYWDNDEQFVVPLLRELDTPTGDRGRSRFYSDAAESKLRARRKERVGLLALWRRLTVTFPVMAIVAAATVTAGGLVRDVGDLVLQAFYALPGHDALTSAGRTLAGLADESILGGFAPTLVGGITWHRWYELGICALQVVFLLLVLSVVIPMRIDRLWRGRAVARVILLAVELGSGVVTLVVIFGFTGDIRTIADLIWRSGAPALIVLAIAAWVLGRIGVWARTTIAAGRASSRRSVQFARDVLIALSTLALAALLAALIAVIAGVALVFAGNGAEGSAAALAATETRRFVLGAGAILIGFSLLARLGTWRWDAWDVRERRALRRSPMAYPYRFWSYFIAFLLVVAAGGAAAVLALGYLGYGALGPVLVASTIVAIVLLSVGKDVVDNDTDIERGGTTGRTPPATIV